MFPMQFEKKMAWQILARKRKQQEEKEKAENVLEHVGKIEKNVKQMKTFLRKLRNSVVFRPNNDYFRRCTRIG